MKLINGDCLQVMRGMDAGSVDAVITDPPYYRIANHEWDKQWSDIYEWGKWCYLWGKESCRVMNERASAYIFGDDKNSAYMQVELDRLDWGLINNIVWSKTNYTALKADPMALRSYRVQAEERILFYGKDITFPSFSQTVAPLASQNMGSYLRGERKRAGVSMQEIQGLFPSATGGLTGCVSNWELGYNFPLKEQYHKIRQYLNNGDTEYLRTEYEYLRTEYEYLRRPFHGNSFTDVWEGKATSGANKMHPSQKPDWIINRIILACTNPGDTVLDPFMGSGTTGVACVQMGRNFIGIELDKDYYDIACKRIAGAQPALF